uniref:Uncharacterized protein n=1 Tax=Manihot esculenta TaxID=3983 RepID=A0A2C9UK81_MANES
MAESAIALPFIPRQLRFTSVAYNNILNIGEQQLRSTSLHAIFAFIVPVLVAFIDIKCQATTKSPFETHPITIKIAIACLLAYCIAYGFELAFCARLSQANARICQVTVAIFGSFALASLASILFPDSAQALYAFYTFLLVGELYGPARKLCSWVRRRVVNATFDFLTPSLRRTSPTLPLTFMDARFSA